MEDRAMGSEIPFWAYTMELKWYRRDQRLFFKVPCKTRALAERLRRVLDVPGFVKHNTLYVTIKGIPKALRAVSAEAELVDLVENFVRRFGTRGELTPAERLQRESIALDIQDWVHTWFITGRVPKRFGHNSVGP